MGIQVIEIDEKGYFKDVHILEMNEGEVLPENMVLPYGSGERFFKPKYDKTLGGWVESLTQEEIDAFENTSAPKSEIEILQEENAELKSRLETAEMAIITLMDFM